MLVAVAPPIAYIWFLAATLLAGGYYLAGQSGWRYFVYSPGWIAAKLATSIIMAMLGTALIAVLGDLDRSLLSLSFVLFLGGFLMPLILFYLGGKSAERRVQELHRG